MWQLLDIQNRHSETEWVGFVVPAVPGDQDWAQDWFHYAHRSGPPIHDSISITLGNGIESKNAYLDIIEYSRLIVSRYICVAIDYFWDFLCESESPLAFILTEELQDADHVAKLRAVFRSQLTDYAVRVLCAEAARQLD